MDAEYVTVVNEYNEQSLELNLTLHHKNKPQANDWVYLFWLQAIDPLKSTPETDFLEGFTCAIRYDSTSGNDGTDILNNYLYRAGYVGTNTLQYAKGSY